MHVVVNPAAAGGRLGRDWPRLQERLRASGLDLPFSLTKAPGHATDLAAEVASAGSEVVVAAGGDGTICECLQGLHAAGRGALAILPLGTGNDAARTLGLPLDFEGAARVARVGARRRVDLIRAGERVVFNAIGIGLLGTINVNAASIKKVRGLAAYLAAAAATLPTYRCPEIELRDGTFHYQGPMTILAVHGGPTTGGGFRLCPAAVPDDGELDATLVTGTTVPQRLGALLAALRGTLTERPIAQTVRSRRLELLCGERLPFHWDGNPAWIEPPGLTFEVVPAAQEIVVPAAVGDVGGP